jgi:D-arabinose 1-dehydrogenase-like Zn-dependent alcohol dehydrogenase
MYPGHLAVQFASKMGAKTYVIGTSKEKREEAKKLGAVDYIDVSDEKEFDTVKGTIDVVVCTANAKGMDWSKYLSLCQFEGTFTILAAPEEDVHFHSFALLAKQINFVGSIIGSRQETQDMLKFASKHKIKALVEEFPLEKVNEAVQKVRDNTIRYRAVLIPTPKTEEAKTTATEAKKA